MVKAALAVARSPALRYAAATLTVSAAGLTGIKEHEGTVHRVYLDPVKIPTVCVGHTGTVSLADVGKHFTDKQCQELLRSDTKAAERAVQRYVTVPVTQAQYDALVSFTFNVGSGNLAGSTLLRKANARDCYGAGREFLRWNRAKGVVLPGLTIRRQWESNLWLSGCQPTT
jgi:lysozyme